MKKLYVIVPIVLLAIFIAFFLNARDGIRQREIAEQKRIQEELVQKRIKEEAAKKVAWEIANAEAQRRIAEHNERLAKEKRQAEETQAAEAERNLAYREKDNLLRQSLGIKESLDTAKTRKVKIEEQLKIQRTQIDYLKTATKDVIQNKTAYQIALQKLQDAEKAYVAKQQEEARAAARAAAARGAN